MTEQRNENPKAYRWHMYWLILAGVLLLGTIAMFGVVQWADAGEGDFLLEVAVPAVLAPTGLALLGVHFRTFFAYHEDAKYLKESESDYSPHWGFWTLGHWIYPPVAVAAYLYQRRRKVGNDYDGTRAGRILGVLNTRSR